MRSAKLASERPRTKLQDGGNVGLFIFLAVAGMVLFAIGGYVYVRVQTNVLVHDFDDVAAGFRRALLTQNSSPSVSDIRIVADKLAKRAACRIKPGNLRVVVDALKAADPRLSMTDRNALSTSSTASGSWLVGFEATIVAKYAFVEKEFEAKRHTWVSSLADDDETLAMKEIARPSDSDEDYQNPVIIDAEGIVN